VDYGTLQDIGRALPEPSSEEDIMANEVSAVDQTTGSLAVQVRLNALNTTVQPVSANYTTATVAPGIAYLDFGFLEPGPLNAIVGSIRAGKPVPTVLDGKLAVRVAVGYDVLQNLHRQVGQILAGLATQAKTRRNGTAGVAKADGDFSEKN
jgi:hypothetical protein